MRKWDRNAAIVESVKNGEHASEVARLYGISRQRVHQIINGKIPSRRRLPIEPEIIFDFIVDYQEEHGGNSPVLREIGAGVGASSLASVYWILKKLEKMGKIELGEKIGAKRKKRSITVIAKIGGQESI